MSIVIKEVRLSILYYVAKLKRHVVKNIDVQFNITN
ncbi:hypothetical protein LCGC14_1066950 [marine sediment metagenome]|uniref:Uncharacterized protein n=1 Tax=marine sediment metagenome TaxID=412755 RepID=A0A0F9QQ66_9ZZZZ